jgi:hypothetical protein
MDKNYKFQSKSNLNFDESVGQLTDLQMTYKHNRRRNEILNGFVFMIGIAGFIVVFMLPRDGVFNNGKLEKSFSNSSQFASSSLALTQNTEDVEPVDLMVENPISISGYYEAGEILKFELNTYKSDSKVGYVIHFGNGDSVEMSEKITSYVYPRAGKFEVKVMAKFQQESKEIFSDQIRIDDAIVVNIEAFAELN